MLELLGILLPTLAKLFRKKNAPGRKKRIPTNLPRNVSRQGILALQWQ
jgi:hypothetical protein